MRWSWILVFLSFTGPFAAKEKGTVVKIDGFQARTPEDWIAQKPSNRLRSYQFRLPRAKDDKEDGELAVMPNITGTPEQILARWKETFLPPDGKTPEEATRLNKMKNGAITILYLDIHGTYLYKDRPLASKSTPKPGYRMLSVHFQTPDGPTRIWVVGPADTVQLHKKGFDDWLKRFK